MKIKSGYLVLTVSWLAMGALCYWCDPITFAGGTEAHMLMSSLWGFVTLVSGIVWGLHEIDTQNGGDTLLEIKPRRKIISADAGNLSDACPHGQPRVKSSD